MHSTLAATDDKAPKTDKVDRLEEQLSFKSRFVMVFGEIDDKMAHATCRRLLALSEESDAPIGLHRLDCQRQSDMALPGTGPPTRMTLRVSSM